MAPDKAVETQLAKLDDTLTAMASLEQVRSSPKEARKELHKQQRKTAQDQLGRYLSATWATDAPFRERWIDFWVNHFTISMQRKQIIPLAGPYILDAIRPKAFGNFRELLHSAIRHPAMLLYLDNVKSIGPNSKAGAKRNVGANENLARELLELHTLGVGNYSQQDVTTLGLLLTGWTLEADTTLMGFMSGEFALTGAVEFRSNWHEPGDKTFLDRVYPESGVNEGLSALDHLAEHPSTIHHLCHKLITHFVCDEPRPELAAKLASHWVHSGGDLTEVAKALISLPAASDPNIKRFRSPFLWTAAVARAIDITDDAPKLLATLKQLGQPFMSAPSPQGWLATSKTWCTPASLITRADVAYDASLLVADGFADIIDLYLPSSQNGTDLGPTKDRDALALLLMSPEFLWI